MKVIMRTVWILAGIAPLLLGCSATRFAHHSRGIAPPYCKSVLHGAKAAVYWDTAWRQDQKEVERREKMLEEGIRSFFGKVHCVETIKISRTIAEKPVGLCAEQEIVADARSRGAGKAIVLRIEEFGPNLMIYLSPILWQTQNEVLLRAKILDTREGSMDADTTSHWFRGGPFTLHGTRSLPQDLHGTLEKLIGSVEE